MEPFKKDWIPCPVCGEPDMRAEWYAEDNGPYVFCVNIACASNGGSNFEALRKKHRLVVAPTEMPLIPGDEVVKLKGYEFPGFVRAGFKAPDGTWRFDVEHKLSKGLMHLFHENQLRKVEP